MAIELGTAYVSITTSTKELEDNIKSALSSGSRHADNAGRDMGSRMASGVSRELTSGAGGAIQGMTNLFLGGAQGIGSQMGGGILGGLTKSLASGASSLTSSLSSMGMSGGQALAGAFSVAAVAGIAAAGVAIGKALYDLGGQFDDMADSITIKTGAMGDRLAMLQQNTKDVANTTAANMGDINNVGAQLNQTLGLQGETLNRVTKQVSDYNEMNKNAPVNLREFSKVVKLFGIDTANIPALLDKLNAAAQDSGVPLNELVSNMRSSAEVGKNFGLTVDGMTNLMTEFEKAGGDASAATGTLRQAIANLGDPKLQALLHIDPKDSPATQLRLAGEELRKLSGNAQADLAKQIFGKSWTEALNLIKQGKLDVDQLNKSIINVGSTVEDQRDATADWAEDFKILKNQIANTFEKPATGFFGYINDELRYLTGFMDKPHTIKVDLDPASIAKVKAELDQFFAQYTAALGLPNVFGGAEPGGPNGWGPQPTTGWFGEMQRRRNDAATGVPGAAGPGSYRPGSNPLLPGSPNALPPGGIPGVGGGGNAYMGGINGPRAIDSWLLSQVPAGRYDASGDLSRGLGDCSSAVEDLVNILDGRGTGGRSMATGNAAEWLTSRGFMPGSMPGAFNVGFNSSHMQATLPGGTNFNWGSNAAAAARGQGGSSGAFDPLLTQRYYRVIPYAGGGGVRGAGGPKSDSIPAMLSNGEHVLSASDVSAMGGQSGVYSFRNALHRADGGTVYGEHTPHWADHNAQKRTKTGVYNPNVPGHIGDPNTEWPGGNFNPGITLDTSVSSVAPRWDKNNLTSGWLAYILTNESGWNDIPGGRDALGSGTREALKNNALFPGFAEGGAVGKKKLEDGRTEGAIPAGAGSTMESGTSGVAQMIAQGGEFVNGLIDQAASAAATAASAAATAGTMGADGGAGGAAASMAIGLGADAAKRGVKYGFQMGGIGVDALMEQLTPFGMPRWLTQDYTGFVPQQQITGALGELMSGGAQKAAAGGAGPGGIGSAAKAMPGTGEQPTGPISNLMGSLSPSVDPSTVQHGQASGAPPGAVMNNSANSFLSTELQQPEVQAPGQQPMFKVDNIYTTDAHGVGEELSKRGRLAQMQYAGRPMG